MDQSIQESDDYYPYGESITTGTNDILKFTGKERDTESGLDNFGARYYGSAMGRFMTPDWAARPIAVPYALFGDPQSLNLYGYVRNDPVTLADADGHGCHSTPDASCNMISPEALCPEGQSCNPLEQAQQKPNAPNNPAQNQSQTQTQQNQQTQQDPNQPVLMAQNRTPAQGQPPDSTVTIPDGKGGSTDRTFGPDGRAVKDIDKGHDHGAGDPHAHDWDWSKARPRGPGRPLTPEEKQALKRVGEGAAAGGTGYIIYRVVRMAPSVLFPPLWETIPLNAAIP